MSSQRGFAPPLGPTYRNCISISLGLLPPLTSTCRLYLPHSIVSCAALVSLTLNGRIHVEKHSSIHLPSLENLEMDTDYVDRTDKLLSGCSVLETLKLIFYGERLPKIRMPSSLKSLTLKNCCRVIQDLEINTPFLEYLDIELVGSCLRFSVSNLPNVVDAHVDLISCITQHDRVFPKLLRALYRTKLLELRYSVLECLPLVLALDLPKFCCLLELDICIRIPFCNSRCLIDSLHKCHMLRVLNIHEVVPVKNRDWTQPTGVPKCVISHLEIFTLRRYQDYADEHEFVAFILERGIHSVDIDLKEKYDILKGLSLIPRGSNTCQLKFY